jgi:hypothetical protein
MSLLYPPGPSTDTYYLNSEFVWEETYQHFFDASSEFVYDIFVQAYVYNNHYYHWNDRDQTYFEIADPYIYAFKDVFGDNPVNEKCLSSDSFFFLLFFFFFFPIKNKKR